MIKQPRITILGGGIGGLALAAFLRREGLEATVYEQAPALTEVGAGIIVAPNSARLLRRMGVIEAFRQHAVPMDIGWEFRRWEDGTVLSAEDLAADCERLYGEHMYGARRADLLDVIRSAVPPNSIQLNAKCIRVDLDGEQPTLHFANGRIETTDVLIGADGIHSLVRDAVTEPTPPAFSGMSAYRALVPTRDADAFARRRAQVVWLGPGHHVVHYPTAAGEYTNLFMAAPAGDFSTESWSATATVEELLAEIEGWDSRLTDLVARADRIGRWALFDRAPLERWSLRTTTLLGDAAHPMFPFYAQGAAQSIEDGAVLAECLADQLDDVENALRTYESIRLPRTTRVQTLSHARAESNHLPDGPEQNERDRQLASSDPLVESAWIYEYDPHLAVANAKSA